MYNANKLGRYKNTANLLNAANSFREVVVPITEVAQQFSELLNEVARIEKNAKDGEPEKQVGQKPKKGGKKPEGE